MGVFFGLATGETFCLHLHAPIIQSEDPLRELRLEKLQKRVNELEAREREQKKNDDEAQDKALLEMEDWRWLWSKIPGITGYPKEAVWQKEKLTKTCGLSVCMHFESWNCLLADNSYDDAWWCDDVKSGIMLTGEIGVFWQLQGTDIIEITDHLPRRREKQRKPKAFGRSGQEYYT